MDISKFAQHERYQAMDILKGLMESRIQLLTVNIEEFTMPCNYMFYQHWHVSLCYFDEGFTSHYMLLCGNTGREFRALELFDVVRKILHDNQGT